MSFSRARALSLSHTHTHTHTLAKIISQSDTAQRQEDPKLVVNCEQIMTSYIF